MMGFFRHRPDSLRHLGGGLGIRAEGGPPPWTLGQEMLTSSQPHLLLRV